MPVKICRIIVWAHKINVRLTEIDSIHEKVIGQRKWTNGNS